MPVRIIRKGSAQSEPVASKSRIIIRRVAKVVAAPAVVVEAPPVMAEPSFSSAEESPTPWQEVLRGWVVGGGLVLRLHDLSEEEGSTKFLLHRIRDKVWYRVRAYDPDERLLSLTSQTKLDFQSRIHSTFFGNYMVAIFPQGTMEPSPEALYFVSRKLPKLLEQQTVQTSAQAVST